MNAVIVDGDASYPPSNGKRLRTLNLMLRLARRTKVRRLTAVEREVARLAASRPADLSPIRGALRALRAQL